MPMGYLVAVDTGGTFTDFVAFDRDNGGIVFRKTLTRYDDLVEGMVSCADDAGLPVSGFDSVKHGSTHVINAFIQRRGARTALVTTRGFRDVLELGRCGRPRAFDLHFVPDPPLIPRALRYEVSARLDGKGRETSPLVIDELAAIADQIRRQGVEAVAVSFLNAYLNGDHEREAARHLEEMLPGVFITTGTALSQEWFEYERTATATANAFVGPSTRRYIERFGERLKSLGNDRPFFMMASHGGVLTARQTVRSPISLIESGPIGGCIGAATYAQVLGLKKVVAFDMGGTTAKCALIEDGKFDVQPTYVVGGAERGFPIRTSVLDIVEVGAGGGSIAGVDALGRLSVGPRSAGAEPGPVAFGRGGTEPTVTDANLVLGRIGSDTFLGGALSLDAKAASNAIMTRIGQPLGYPASNGDVVAQGILTLASLTMGDAIREITIERGRDVREYDLFVFGGGGPLHGAALARELHIPRVIVPPEPGNFSAVGMLLSDARVDESRTMLRPLDSPSLKEVQDASLQMIDRCREQLASEFKLHNSASELALELRYRGQKHSLRIQAGEDIDCTRIKRQFDEAYHRRYGHSDPGNEVEVVGLHVSVHAVTDRPDLQALARREPATMPRSTSSRSVYFPELSRRVEAAIFRRSLLPCGFAATGPAIIEEYGSTTVVGPFDRFEIGSLGEIVIHCDGGQA
jgi:N-methylhydantoinase A